MLEHEAFTFSHDAHRTLLDVSKDDSVGSLYLRLQARWWTLNLGCLCRADLLLKYPQMQQEASIAMSHALLFGVLG